MWPGPAMICRQDEALISSLDEPRAHSRTLFGAATVVIAGSAIYGVSFGCWRSPEQAIIAAIKMPMLMVAVIVTAGLINALLAAIIHPGFTRWHVGYGMLSGFAVTASVLGAFSPVLVFFAMQAPAPDSPDAMVTYRVILLIHTSCVGIAGTAGFLRLRSLLLRLTGCPERARHVLLAWIATCGLAGFEWSWLLSPFLARPDMPVPLLNPIAFSCNVFEYIWRAIAGTL